MFKLTIKTENEAFEDPGFEVARILRAVADRIEKDQLTEGRCIDFNGNRVGEWTLDA